MSLGLTENLTAKLSDNASTLLLDRQPVLEKLREVFARQQAVHPILVAPFGSGRTTALSQFAAYLFEHPVPNLPEGVQVRRLDMDDFHLQSDEHFADNLQRVIASAENATQPNILFFDELDVLDERHPDFWSAFLLVLEKTMQKGQLSFGLVCSSSVYQRIFLPLKKWVYKVEVVEAFKPSQKEVFSLFESHLTKKTNIALTEEFLTELIQAADRYVTSLSLPASAIVLLDKVLAQAKLNVEKEKKVELNVSHLKKVLMGWYGVQLSSTALQEPTSLICLAERLQKNLFGQERALQILQKQLLASSVQGVKNPVLIFAGQESVGKKTAALYLHRFLYGVQIPPFILDLLTVKDVHIFSLLADYLKKYKEGACIFLNADQANAEVLSVLQQYITGAPLYHQSGEALTFVDHAIVLTYQVKKQSEMLCFDMSQPVEEEKEELLQLVLDDFPRQQQVGLQANSDGFSSAMQSFELKGLPEFFTKQGMLVGFHPLSYVAREKLVEVYLEKLAHRLMLKYALILFWHAGFVKTLLFKCQLSHLSANKIHHKLNDLLSPTLSDILINMDELKEKKIELIFSDDIISYYCS